MILTCAILLLVCPLSALSALALVYLHRVRRLEAYIDRLLHSEEFWRGEFLQHCDDHEDEHYRPHSDQLLR